MDCGCFQQINHDRSDRSGFPVERVEYHVKNTLLARFKFVQHRQAGAHRTDAMQKICIPSREYDDPVFVHSGTHREFEELEAIHGRHFKIDKHQIITADFNGMERRHRIVTDFYLQQRKIVGYIRPKEAGKGQVIIN